MRSARERRDATLGYYLSLLLLLLLLLERVNGEEREREMLRVLCTCEDWEISSLYSYFRIFLYFFFRSRGYILFGQKWSVSRALFFENVTRFFFVPLAVSV